MQKERTAIVTGGARGIGFSIAQELTRQGMNVAICSRTESQWQEALDKLSKEIIDGRKVYGMTVDVSNYKDCKKFIDYVVRVSGRIDVLVNNAGIFGPVGLLEKNKTQDWKKVLETNILGAVYMCQLVVPHMKKNSEGKIINLAGAGVGGPKPLPRFSGYYVTKAAIVSLTENLAAELVNDNIQVNAISPGAVASELTLGLLKLDKKNVGEDMLETAEKLKIGGGTPLELTQKLIAFLVSQDSNHITGRLLSAKWDSIDELKNLERFTNNSYKLRRVDNKMFSEKND